MDQQDEFKEDIKLDPNELDVAAATQGELFIKWAERAVKARTEMEYAKLQLETKQARLQIRCRKSPRKFKLEKLTEGAIQAAVLLHPEYQAAHEHYLDARQVCAMLEKAVNGMEMRKRMIEVLITLHGQQYFAGPSVPRDLSKAYREFQEGREDRVKERQVKRMKKKKKKKKKRKEAD
jgi:hypothetical protein